MTMNEPWLACQAPERRFDAWMWLDDCEVCLRSLQREAAKRPRLTFCLKTSADRVYVTAARLCEVLSNGQALETLCCVEDDWVCEVFVVRTELPSGMDQWSLTLAEKRSTKRQSSNECRLSPWSTWLGVPPP